MKAFPSKKPVIKHLGKFGPIEFKPIIEDGMDLRDYFAAKAMQSLLTHDLAYLYDKAEQISLDTAEEYVVETAFHIADEMMKARNK